MQPQRERQTLIKLQQTPTNVVHIQRKSLPLNDDFHNYILHLRDHARAETNTDSCGSRKDHWTVQTGCCTCPVSLACWTVNYFGIWILHFGLFSLQLEVQYTIAAFKFSQLSRQVQPVQSMIGYVTGFTHKASWHKEGPFIKLGNVKEETAMTDGDIDSVNVKRNQV